MELPRLAIRQNLVARSAADYSASRDHRRSMATGEQLKEDEPLYTLITCAKSRVTRLARTTVAPIGVAVAREDSRVRRSVQQSGPRIFAADQSIALQVSGSTPPRSVGASFARDTRLPT